MFGQLLDGHPNLLTFPGEFATARPKDDWPRTNPDQYAFITFRKLANLQLIRKARSGFYKGFHGHERLSFDYDVELHQSIFVHMYKNYKPFSQREILDLFFTSFFAAWRRTEASISLGKETRYFCAFAAGFSINEDAVSRYFSDYPDGHLISILRNPRNWLPSELKKREISRKSAKLRNTMNSEFVLEIWRRSAEAMIRNSNAFPARVTIIDFDDLILCTKKVMEQLAKRVGIEFDPCLLVPTFDGKPIESNSSFAAVKGLVDSSVLSRDAGNVPGMDRCLAIYERVRALNPLNEPL